MVLLDNGKFLTELHKLYEANKDKGTVWVTLKRSECLCARWGSLGAPQRSHQAHPPPHAPPPPARRRSDARLTPRPPRHRRRRQPEAAQGQEGLL